VTRLVLSPHTIEAFVILPVVLMMNAQRTMKYVCKTIALLLKAPALLIQIVTQICALLDIALSAKIMFPLTVTITVLMDLLINIMEARA
jgi:hypothetical protein